VSGVIPYLKLGPSSYQVLSGTITGGQLVIPDPSNPGGIITAVAGASNVLGVAGLDGGVVTSQDGQNPANLAQQQPWVPVYYGVDIPVTYGAACEFGTLLMAGASGAVVPYTPPSIGGATISAPSVPATGVTAQNTYNETISVVISGGTLTGVFVNGDEVGTAAGTYEVPANGTIEWTGSAAPTWTWALVGESVTTPSVPATTVAVQNTTGYNVQVVVTGGTVTAVKVNGATVLSGDGTATVPAGSTISITYSAAPTWAWTPLTTTFDMIVGRCTEPLGVQAAATVARARIGGIL
jgi:hypothetical protein